MTCAFLIIQIAPKKAASAGSLEPKGTIESVLAKKPQTKSKAAPSKENSKKKRSEKENGIKETKIARDEAEHTKGGKETAELSDDFDMEAALREAKEGNKTTLNVNGRKNNERDEMEDEQSDSSSELIGVAKDEEVRPTFCTH